MQAESKPNALHKHSALIELDSRFEWLLWGRSSRQISALNGRPAGNCYYCCVMQAWATWLGSARIGFDLIWSDLI